MNATKQDAITALKTLRGFIGIQQLAAIADGCRGEEKQFFFDKLVELARTVSNMAKTYEQEGKGDNAIVHLHYFAVGQANWYITEKDTCSEQLQAFGLADLYGDGGEVGYISIKELLECGAELDFHFTPRKLCEVQDRAVVQGSAGFHEFLTGSQS